MIRLTAFLFASFLIWSGIANAQSVDDWQDSYTLEAKGEYEKAAALLVPYMDNGEESELALIRYGWLNYLQGNFNDATRSYKRALERNQRSFDARLGIVLPLMAQKRWRESAGHLKQLLALSPYNYTAHIRLMACEEGMRKWKMLAKHAKEIAAYYPSDASALIYLARSYAWQGDKDKASAAYGRVLIRYPTNFEAIRYLNQDL